MIENCRAAYLAGERDVAWFEEAVARCLNDAYLRRGPLLQYDCCGTRWGQVDGPVVTCIDCGKRVEAMT